MTYHSLPSVSGNFEEHALYNDFLTSSNSSGCGRV